MMDKQCRLCLSRCHLRNIFSLEGVQARIQRFLSIEVTETGLLSTWICIQCCGRLRGMDDFYKDVHSNQDKLLESILSQPELTGVLANSRPQVPVVELMSDDDSYEDDYDSDSDIEFVPIDQFSFPKPMILPSNGNDEVEFKPYRTSDNRLVQSQGTQVGDTLEEEWQVFLQKKSRDPEFTEAEYEPTLMRVLHSVSHGRDAECQIRSEVKSRKTIRFQWTLEQKAIMKIYFNNHFNSFSTPTAPEIAEFLLAIKDDSFRNISATKVNRYFKNRRYGRAFKIFKEAYQHS